MSWVDLENRVEAVLFASGEPISGEKLCLCCDLRPHVLEEILERLEKQYAKRGICLLRIGLDYQLATRQEHAPFVRALAESKKDAPLSQAALEVLAIIAYNEPVTRNFIEQVRGVDSSGVVNTLVAKNLVEESGRLDLPGRPIAYRTTTNFLRCFSLADRGDLPPVEKLFAELATEDQDQTQLAGMNDCVLST